LSVDLNGDGYLDLVLCNDNGPLQYYINTAISGGRSLVKQTDIASTGRFLSAAAMEIDNSGNIDLVTATYDQGLRVYISNTNGTYNNITSPFIVNNRTGITSVKVMPACWSASGNKGIWFSTSSNLYRLTNYDGYYYLSDSLVTGVDATDFCFQDHNDDGKAEIITGRIYHKWNSSLQRFEAFSIAPQYGVYLPILGNVTLGNIVADYKKGVITSAIGDRYLMYLPDINFNFFYSYNAFAEILTKSELASQSLTFALPEITQSIGDHIMFLNRNTNMPNRVFFNTMTSSSDIGLWTIRLKTNAGSVPSTVGSTVQMLNPSTNAIVASDVVGGSGGSVTTSSNNYARFVLPTVGYLTVKVIFPNGTTKVYPSVTPGNYCADMALSSLRSVVQKVYETVIDSSVQGEVALKENSPNPFNPVTKIRFELPKTYDGFVKTGIVIYDVKGREIYKVGQNNFKVGSNEVVWNGVNTRGEKMAAGVYICMLNYGNMRKSIKMTMVK
jgi:hypothetical protein